MITFSSKSAVVALLTLVLALGGCLPCQELSAAVPASASSSANVAQPTNGQQSKKSCCNAKGQCERTARQGTDAAEPQSPDDEDCSLQSADMQVDRQQQSNSSDAGDAEGIDSVADRQAPSCAAGIARIDAVHFSPPPLFLLHSSLRI